MSHRVHIFDSKRLPEYDRRTREYFDKVPDHKYTSPEKHKESKFIEFISQNDELNDSVKVLDLGCGKGDFLRLVRDVRPDAQVVGVDISMSMLRASSKKGDPVLASVSSLPFKQECFDIVHLDAVLHHLVGPTRCLSYLQTLRAVSEAERVIRKGGWLLVAEPIYEPALVGAVIFWVKRVLSFLIGGKRLAGLGAPVCSFYTERDIVKMLPPHLSVESCNFRNWKIPGLMRLLVRRRGRLYLIAKK